MYTAPLAPHSRSIDRTPSSTEKELTMLMPTASPLAELEQADEFVSRHIGPDGADEACMLSAIGAASRRALIEAVVPRSIARAQRLQLAEPVSEAQALAELRAVAAKNRVFRSYIGQGYHGTLTPAVILRNVLENPAWYTAYTPYQAEISQGRLEALVNFQTMVCELTGLAIANASMLDEATAAAEAMTLAKRSVKSKSDTLLIAADCHPQTIEVLRLASVIASAAAVASSSIEALAIARPVSSQTMVWKFTSASSRPCEISAW